MGFPAESVTLAKDIAAKYALRTERSLDKASRLYHGEFLHLGYGFADAIKQGRCGVYLHEAKTCADCFSFAGILYLIARETDLKPKLFWASGLKDVADGKDPTLIDQGFEHAFITVRGGSKEICVDPNMGLYGEVAWLDHGMRIRNKDNVVKRDYTTIEQLSEERYLAMLERNRSSGGGKLTLGSTQKVTSDGLSVMLSYREPLLRTWLTESLNLIFDDPWERSYTSALEAPVAKDGACALEEGTFIGYFAQHTAWSPEEHTGVTNTLTLPAPVVARYVEHLERGHSSTHRTPLKRMRHLQAMIERAGFDRFGEIVRKNGVDEREHRRVLDAIDAAFDRRQQDDISTRLLDRKAMYLARSEAAKCPANPRGLLFAAEEYEACAQQEVSVVAGSVETFMACRVAEYRAAIRGRQAERRARDETNRVINTIDDNHRRFNAIVFARQSNPTTWQELMDVALYRERTPLESCTATDAERRKAFRHMCHKMMIANVLLYDALRVRKFRKGLQRILASEA